MKRFAILLSVFALFGLMVNCGGGTSDIPGPEVKQDNCNHEGQEIILQSAQETAPPDWVFGDRGWRGVDEGGEQVYYFYAEGDSKEKKLAERSARANAAAAAAESIMKNVLSQAAEAIESWGTAEDEEIEQVRMSLVAFKSKVTVTDQHDAGMFAYQFSKVGGLKEDNCTADPSKSITSWRFVLRQAIPYSTYQEMRGKAMGEAKEKAPNEKQKEMLKKAEEAMAQLDQF